MNEAMISSLAEMEAKIVEHGELKLIGIPLIGVNDMGSKYRQAKESLLGLSNHMPQIIDSSVQYGMWSQSSWQDNPNTFAYILSIEVSTFEGIPEWFVRMTISPQRCVVAASKEGDFDGAGQVINDYISKQGIIVDTQGRDYTICERYRYNAEGFARYSLPIVD